MAKAKNTIPANLKYTVADFNTEFPNDAACLTHIFEARWPGGITVCDSEKCGNVERKHHHVTGRTAYACDYCGKHIYPLAGTIFEKSTTSLKTWFYAMYLMGSTRCGISAKQIQRETGVTYKTAWRMFKQIRTLMAEDVTLEGSPVEVDEAYYGGKRKNGTGRPMRGDKVKTPILGMVERGGKVVAKVIPDTTAKTLCGNVREYVLPSSTVFTDELNAYNTMSEGRRYTHHRIKHSSGIYVVGNVHTNTIEGFWSLIKRGVGGVYHSVSQKYLQSYLDEYSFRYNRRNQGNLIFTSILRRVSEKAF
jgi:transposase-like protein